MPLPPDPAPAGSATHAGTSDAPLDLSACEAERIDAPGRIQGHGQLIALDRASGRVVAASANLAEGLGHAPEAIVGRTAEELDRAFGLDGRLGAALAEFTPSSGEPTSGAGAAPRPVAAHGDAVVLVSAGRRDLLVERRIEPASRRRPCPPLGPEEPEAALAALDRRLAEAGDTSFALAEATAAALRGLTGFDRVMVYRFAEDWHGEVLADARAADLPPYLGLHYPASDIPPQARRLYLETRIREIVDTLALPVALVPAADAAAERPVDLSPAVLRGISPYHLDYMSNMGIRGTLVASIVVEGRLWGLVACHHRQPALVPWRLRAAVMAATDRLADALADRQRRAADRNAQRARAMLDRVAAALAEPDRPLKAFLDVLATGTRSAGVAVVSGADAIALGNAPPADHLPALGAALVAAADTTAEPGTAAGQDAGARLVLVDRLEALLPQAAAWRDRAAGVAALVVDPAVPVVIAGFRPEHLHEVSWGGDPSRPAEHDPATGKLSPRRSFAVWKQTVEGRSRPWEPEIVAFLETLAAGDVPRRLTRGLNEALRNLRGELSRRDVLHSAVMNVALDGMLLTAAADTDHVIRLASANQAFRHLFDLTPEECEALSLDDLMARLGVVDFDPAAAGWSDREIRAWSPEHGARDVLVHRRTVLDAGLDGDRSTWSIWVFQDITELRRKEQALVVARDRALAEARAKSEFLANMSHELRTPLNAVIGYAEMIETGLYGPLGSPKYAEGARDIAAAGRHLLSLIESLLDLSRMDAGRRELQEEVFDLAEAAVEAVEWVERDPRTGSVAIALEAPADGLPVQADRVALSQVIVNLVGNAAKFSDPGSRVTVTVASAQGGCPSIVVTDQGPGIPADRIDQMFEPFRQGENVYARRHGGVGLGLAIARSLVDLHDGSIRIASSLGNGTEVTVLLPRNRARTAAIAGAVPAAFHTGMPADRPAPGD